MITPDKYKPYKEKILEEYGKVVTPGRNGKSGRPRKALRVQPPELIYATVHKCSREGRIHKTTTSAVFGSMEQVRKAISESEVSHHVNVTLWKGIT